MTLGDPNPNNPKVLDPKSQIGPVLEADHSDLVDPRAFAVWTFAASAWLTTLALPLIVFPRITSLVFSKFLAEVRKPDPLTLKGTTAETVAANTATAAAIAATSRVVRTLNPLEKVLGIFAGMVCLALASLLIIQTGAIPLTTRAVTPEAAVAPYRKPTLWIAVAFFTTLSYTSYSLALYPIAIPSAAISAWGFWVVFFAHLGRVNQVSSKTSSFPFKNAAAEEKKQEQRDKRE
ncbi:hypothetical protein JCM10908_000444 [Rhodotorula pacifica]|uniref:uncharacterized protein n=1 Tax=Rhodotorula pacifica TaxID=1495444 RepID=UPI00317D8DAC